MARGGAWASSQLFPGVTGVEWKWEAGGYNHLQNIPYLCQNALTEVWHVVINDFYNQSKFFLALINYTVVFIADSSQT